MSEVFLKLQLERLENGGYVGTSKEFPGLVVEGRTIAEAVEIAQDVARKLLESYAEHGDVFPPAVSEVGQYVEVGVAVGVY